jgi:hypothetical protein
MAIVSTRNNPLMNKVLKLLNDNLTGAEIDTLAYLIDSGADDLHVDVARLSEERNPYLNQKETD